MKKQLLFLAILFLIITQGFSQAQAYPAPDINQCGNEVFDLTVQTPIILDNQDPEHFTVTYYTTQANAVNSTNPIIYPSAFISPQQQMIFAKVTSTADDTSAITVFNLSWIIGVGENLDMQPNPIYGCDMYLDGTAEFDLTDVIPNIVGSQSQLSFTFYATLTDASLGVNQIANAENFINYIEDLMTLYVRLQSTTTGCFVVVPFQIIAIDCNTNKISGFVTYNTNGNCDTFEAPAAGIPVYCVHNNVTYTTFTNPDGYYIFKNVQDGANNVYLSLSSVFSISPPSYNFVMTGEEENVNFCITATQNVNDAAVTLVPLTDARPGFEASYALIYENLGSTTLSGTVSVQFDASKITYTGSSQLINQTGNTLTLNYSDLDPFEKKSVTLFFTIMAPQVVPIGTVLNFSVSITPVTGDFNSANNTDILSQTAINSYDPNDIAVREGEFISQEQEDDYLHYTVRFQNTGNANAEIVRLETLLDVNLDWTTFEPLEGSHDYRVNREGNKVEFIFNDINLAYEDANEPESHGYAVYRIKPKATVNLGDSMLANVNIYFDFNDPIFTNTVTTTVQETAGLKSISSEIFNIYPNPASAFLTINLQNTDAGSFEVTVTDVSGKTLISTAFEGVSFTLNTAGLAGGVYLINLTAEDRQYTKKIIIR